jgi:branched-chain amino acid transport system substrate-binding protein
VLPAGKLLVVNELPDTDPQKAVLREYADAYKAKYGKDADTFGGHAWDAIQTVANALKTAGLDKAKLRDAIETTKDFAGTAGTFTFSPTDHNGLTEDDLVGYVAKGGAWTLLQ